ncbi:MAG: type II toxin-antitoxin system VapC family toxin [Bacteroidota bacterium]
MNYLLDTNIVLIYGRASSLSNKIEEKYQLFDGTHNLFISVVTLGELDSLIKQLNYGEKKKSRINTIVEDLVKLDIHYKEIIEQYGDIDAYSQGKLKTEPSNFSSRNMGKNDLWIAATANVYDLTLITTDKDFEHLRKTFLNLEYVNLEDYS